MTRAFWFLPAMGLIVFAGYLGFQAGRLPTETEIIDRFAAHYLTLAPQGARVTDCAANPHPDPTVRLVVSCAHPQGTVTTFYVGPRGAAVAAPSGPDT